MVERAAAVAALTVTGRPGLVGLATEQTNVDVRPVALAWSGGKDSSLALAALRADPTVEVVALVTTITGDFDRISMHGVRRSVLEAQVAALRLPLVEATIPAAASNLAYEEAFAGALAVLQQLRPNLRHLAFGDLFLADVRAYRERLLPPLGWTPVFPLWGRDTATLAREFTTAGYHALITCVDTTQLGPEFAGREFDAALLADLPATVDPCGERGEFHTCVYAGPIFRHPIALQAGARVRRDGRFEYCDVILRSATTALQEQGTSRLPQARGDRAEAVVGLNPADLATSNPPKPTGDRKSERGRCRPGGTADRCAAARRPPSPGSE